MCERKDDAVTMNRVNVTGIPGITAVYHGAVAKDDTVSGTVTLVHERDRFRDRHMGREPKAPRE